MLTRCYNPNSDSYAFYGSRGIRVCDEWLDYSVFEQWAIANGYEDTLTIDRIDFNAGYNPDNCRWVSVETQSRNTRRTRFITIGTETRPLIDWAERLNRNYRTVMSRLNSGWDSERALFTPTKTPFKKEGGFSE